MARLEYLLSVLSACPVEPGSLPGCSTGVSSVVKLFHIRAIRVIRGLRMDNSQIENALTRLFDDERNRIVFWNDPDQTGALEAKIRLAHQHQIPQ
jgi:hypothetical protein